jgi:subtilisin family serine protease
VVVASAGNDGTSSGFAPYIYPASFTGVIAVAAVTSSGARAFFSEQNSSVLLSAPGVGVIGAGPGGEYLDAEGTSPSAALVSGVVALIRSRYPALSPALVAQALITSTAHRPSGGYSTGTGFGEVDAAAALRAAGRLAAATPETGLATAKFFGTPGHASPAIRPIQVVHRNTRLIAAYTAAAYGGAVCAIIATVLLIWMIRRSRRDRRQAPTFAPAPRSPFQAPPWAQLQQLAQPEQVLHARVDLHPARHPGAGDVHR